MQWTKRMLRAGAVLASAFLGGFAATAFLQPETPAAGMVDPSNPGIAGTFGVGGVLTAAGDVWQYRPDKDRWVTLDESFALEGQATGVAPLPVPVSRVRHMETFGFLVTDEACYLYDLDGRAWKNIGMPPMKR
jgi:hypothetical protein